MSLIPPSDLIRQLTDVLGEELFAELALAPPQTEREIAIEVRGNYSKVRIAYAAMLLMRWSCSEGQIRWWFTAPNDRFAGQTPTSMIWQTRTRQVLAAAEAFSYEFGFHQQWSMPQIRPGVPDHSAARTEHQDE